MTETYDVANISQFNGTIPKTSQLQTEIVNSNIANTLLHITMTGNIVDIVFDTTIDNAERTILNGLVVAHVPTTMPHYDNTITRDTLIEAHTNTVYKRLTRPFVYEGSDYVGSIAKITAISCKDAGVTSYSLKLFDMTNDLVIAEKSFTNTTESVVELTPINNLPSSQAILELQGKKTGGGGTDEYHVSNLTIYI